MTCWQSALKRTNPRAQIKFDDEMEYINEVPPVTAQQILVRTKERKAKSTLLMAIPDEHIARFHGIKDAKTLWDVIKTRFGGNAESKKMQKNVLKQQFEIFSVSNSEGLDKGYDRFQRLLSLLGIHGACVSTEDANQKFLRSLPSAWSNIYLIMRNMPGINNLDTDDLYNNLKVYEANIKGSFGSSSNSQNVVMLSMRVKRFYKKIGRKLEFNRKEPIGFEKTKVEYYNCHRRGHFARDCRSARYSGNRSRDAGNAGYRGRDNEKEATDFALTAFTSNPSSSSSLNSERKKLSKANIEIIGYQYGLESIEGQLRVHQQNKVIFKEKIAVLEYEVKDKSNLLKYTQKQLDEALREKEDLKAKLENFETSLKNLTKLLDSQISVKVKTGLGYDSQFHEKEVLDIREQEVTETVSDNRSSDEKNSLANDRFKKGEGYHAVPPPLTGNYMPPKPDLSFAGLDDSIYEFKISETVTSLTKDNKDAPETSTAIFTRSGKIPVSAAKPKAAASTCAAKLVNTTRPKQSVNFSNSRKAVSVVKKNGVNPVKTSAASINESNLWHRRLGHVDFKTLNKLVKGNLAEAVNTACYVLNRALVTKTHNKTPYELLNGRTPRLDFMRPFGCPVTILNTLDHLGKFKGKVDEGFLVGYSVTSKAFRVFNTKTRKVEENLRVRFIENKPNVIGIGPNWLFDINSLTNSMNYIPVSAGNQTDKNAGPQDTNSNASTQDNVDAGKEVSDQHHIVLPLWSSISSTFKSLDDKATDDKPTDNTSSKTIEEPVNKEDQAYRDKLDRLMSQEKEAINAASTLGTFSAAGPLSPHPGAFISANTLLHVDQDDSLIPDLEDTAELQSTSIFNSAYDDDLNIFDSSVQSVGAEANFNNMESSTIVSPIPTHRLHLDHPKDQILGDPKSAVQTRGMAKKSSEAHALMEPKKVSQALDDASWVEAMQEELLQFSLQKVWRLVDLPYGKKAIGTKWVYRNKKDERGIVVRNKARPVAQGHRQEEGIDYDAVFSLVARIEAIRIFLAFASYMGFIFYQMDVYVDDIIFRSTKRSLCDEFEALMHKRFQMSPMGELTFFLGLQVTPKLTHLHAVKRIFRYLKGQPKLGLWYPRDSPFDLEAYSDGDYAGANLDKKSTAGAFNSVKQIHAIVDGKAVVISKSSVRNDLLFNDEDGRGGSVERVITTDASLVAAQDNNNITKTQSTTMSNDPISQEIGSGDRHRCQETTLGDTDAQTRVLALEEAKTTQDKVITRLKLRVMRLEKKRKAKTSQPMQRRLFKGRVKTSTDKSLEDRRSSEKGGSTADQVSTAMLEVSTATPSTPSTTTTIFGDEDFTIAQLTSSTTTLQPLPTIDPKDKGRGVLVEEELKKQSWTEHKRKDKSKKRLIVALTKEFDEIQAKMDADHELAAIRNKPPTRTQVRNKMITYLEHMGKYTHQQLKHKTFEELQKLYRKEQKWIDDFVPMNSEKEEKKSIEHVRKGKENVSSHQGNAREDVELEARS
uniref:Uncharacterized protein n=1 Tax=Tanacetum cinerariifolium TaxID=118510 RepID=A0A6L2KB77_TANCI|nr:hypothetical protein [Tanacetum cinerariifolium]